MSTQCTFITRMQSIYGTHALIQRCKWPLDVSFFLFISSCYIHIPVRIPNESSKKAFISCIISLELFSYCSLYFLSSTQQCFEFKSFVFLCYVVYSHDARTPSPCVLPVVFVFSFFFIFAVPFYHIICSFNFKLFNFFLLYFFCSVFNHSHSVCADADAVVANEDDDADLPPLLSSFSS